MQKWIEQLRFSASVRLRCGLRGMENFFQRGGFAEEVSTERLPCLVCAHRSPIFRNFAGVDPVLFQNKKTNLRLATRPLKGLLIRPGETFSLWHKVGPPKARRGYLEGLAIRRGEPVRSIGGGLCQLSNAIFWLALHSDLKVVERHRHSVDLFPDDHRTVPFGTGATIVYNFKDLRLFNPAPWEYQFDFEVREDIFVARLFASHSNGHRYVVREAEGEFIWRDDGLYRKNTILRETWNGAAKPAATEILFRNFSKCRYTLTEVP